MFSQESAEIPGKTGILNKLNHIPLISKGCGLNSKKDPLN